MSDHGFNFNPPPSRRERKEFEPPPWEKDRFDEVARGRQDRQEAAAEPVVGGAQEEPEQEPAAERSVVESGTGVGPCPTGRPVDENRVATMLFELKAEDPPADRSFNRVASAAGLLLVVLGVLLVIWATTMVVVASRQPEQGRTGMLIGLTVMMFGAGFAGTGAWFLYRSLRQQGVL